MNRRNILGAAAAAAPAALAAPALAQTQNPEIRWRLQSSFPRNLDILFFGAEQISKRVAELTDNRFRITAFPAGEIAPALQVLDAVSGGTIECGQTPLYWYIGKDPSLTFFTSIPFGGNYRQQGAWMKRGGGNELCAEVLKEYNLVGFPFGDTGVQMGGWFRNEIRSLQDVNGLKFRIAGMGGRVFQRMGAVPQLIAGSDIYPSLERGVIDAAEWVGPYDDEKLGFHRVARFYYAPGFWEPCARGHFLVNQRAWDPLPDAYKAAIQVACAEVELEMMARYDQANPLALRRLVAQGAQLRAWPREVMQAAWRETNGLFEETAAQNARFKRIWEAYRPFRDDQFQWFRIAENAYDNFAFTAAAR
ncbi:TRAP transporter substrate-binding protein [Paracraurococcus ruber]|uniref:ABC transporter substrate-binding protein n=1 Tax=Paracraurococcus ruber TaxID=77675 RepID=A0ABS1D262_9PROT|nr:TRAP transporter substrate-binding protein DctP [Paracraurococcus ruber]MBK1660004.1 ABC transporter substrate-binding protein [Paracraurococcus ruber]TDG28716.1 ABC transporter substrate-binding protein [Paracraurococcus ruber]